MEGVLRRSEAIVKRNDSSAGWLSHRTLLRYGIGVSAVWSLIVAVSLATELVTTTRQAEKSAYYTAQVHLAKDRAFCEWAASRGGIYVASPAGPQRNAPGTGEDGGGWTRLNSFQILREINAELGEELGVIGRFTSLDPLRPENAPDPWERQVLDLFLEAPQEVKEIVEFDGQRHMRVMRPIRFNENCFDCHDFPAEDARDLRSGVSVSVPLSPFVSAQQQHAHLFIGLHGAYWLFGIGVVGFVTARAKSQLREREGHENELAKAYAYTRSVIGGLGEGLYGVDTEGRLTFMNPTAEALLGWRESELMGKHVHEAIHYQHADGSLFPERECPLMQVLHKGEPYSTERDFFIRKDRTILPVAYIATPLREEGEVVGSVMAFQDITHRKEAEQKIQYLAHHDALTGLPNRNLMTEMLNHNLAIARRYGGALALLFIDLDNFSLVNDAGGHLAGDQLLSLVAERLREIIREPDVLARQGGDEFIVLIVPPIDRMSDVSSQTATAVSVAASVARRILSSLRQPFLIGDHEIFVNASIGVSVYPEDATDDTGLFKNADTAMYHVKRKGGGGYVLYGGELSRKYERQQELELLLHKAVQHGQFVVLYQPVVHLRSGRLVGVEALVRWHEPTQGIVLPGEFIPLAERNGLIVPIGQWVLSEACRQLVRWRAKGHSVFVSVNLSQRQFMRSDIVAEVSKAVEEAGADTESLVLEITESAMMNDPDQAFDTLNALRKKGLRLALDDFGTGFSSLTRLKMMPVDTLKIDKSFVAGIPHDTKDLSIIRSTVQMARNLGKTPLAEGIETLEQMRFLVEQECELGQGFLFSRPVPTEAIDAILEGGTTWTIASQTPEE
jgi:diguanylate cyclase (GGDEF)-like protein/PAS domain S-box-containing protein